ncbi:hypothetical protein E2C01_097620 [Portunus trituberculatus]|uniref:Uncharacterized protein n=1 Tax=Portunus trituberculatus TaxID=210409 RepID=A0A5B7KBV8_PORTR|nr:hypothetical protein [Portunus trituberculatus]
MMSLQRLRDSRDFTPYSSSTEWADEDKTSSSADVEGPAVAGSWTWRTSFFDTTETFSKSFDVQATRRFFFLVSLFFCLL